MPHLGTESKVKIVECDFKQNQDCFARVLADEKPFACIHAASPFFSDIKSGEQEHLVRDYVQASRLLAL